MLCGGLRTHGITKKSTDENPLITIVTVVYNGETTLEQTIQSVVNQTYDNVEYIIVDGGSKDGTLDIIKKYEDKIDYWQSEPDKGIYDAMNKGVVEATGEWIFFLNSGDVFYNNNVLSHLFYSKIDPNVDIIYGRIQNNKEITYIKPTFLNLFMEKSTCHQSIFARKKCFINNNFDLNYRIVADRKWIYQNLRNKCKFLFMNEIIVYYDLEGISSNVEKFRRESLLLQKECFGIIGVLFSKIHIFMFNMIKGS